MCLQFLIDLFNQRWLFFFFFQQTFFKFVMVCLDIIDILSFLTCIGRVRPASPYVGSVQTPRGAYVGGFGYQQPLSYSYQQGLVYPPYG